MLKDSLDHHWMSRAKVLTQLLILSGTLNIGFLSAIIYSVLKEKTESMEYRALDGKQYSDSNQKTLQAYSQASFQDLVIRLESADPLEDGYTKRDLALGCLVTFHHLSIEKALGGIPLQKRLLSFKSTSDRSQQDICVFAGLKDEHFNALLQFIKIEKWPLTTEGLFLTLQKQQEHDPSLVNALCCTAEFHAIQTLLQKHLPQIDTNGIIDLIKSGTWSYFKQFAQTIRVLQSYDIDLAAQMLYTYAIEQKNSNAAEFLFTLDSTFILKKTKDTDLYTILDLLPVDSKQQLAKALLVSPRNDDLRKQAAHLLYAAQGLQIPEPYDHLSSVLYFFPEKKQDTPIEHQSTPPTIIEEKKSIATQKLHKIQEGDNLWKIARKYKVSVEAIKKANKLETDRLRVGKELIIPLQEPS